ncbi:MAG: inositol-phosphate phosphatase/L-galactose 1-phosphate phosphatase/histidinol-phosphatase [Parasphingorhabdus sp.]|jgi:inositol-phosphate phosphatase/L-galactose 1-phosphate phosphatase/histidinol-phosphatase
MPGTRSLLTDSIIETAGLLAETARTSTMKWFRQPVEVQRKEDATPVTQVDRETEQSLIDIIQSRHFGHEIIGEELGTIAGSEPWSWIIDPIDGTKSFLCGKPTFGSLIALTHAGRPVLGIIEMPALEERWTGIAGLPAIHNGKPCKASKRTALDDAVLLATTPDMFSEADWQTFSKVSTACRFRNFGTDCYGYGLLASGYVDVVMEASLSPYDYMALIPVVEGAGGIISDWQGNKVDLNSGHQVLACANKQLHTSVLEIINS